MKTKAILFVGAAALVTLSFTFVNKEKAKPRVETTVEQNAPVGGLGAEDIIK